MKKYFLLMVLLFIGLGMTGCISVELDPESGPPGTPVYVKTSGMFGDPVARCIKWNGEEISRPCTSSFMVPAVTEGGTPGKHRVTVVDELDPSEAMLIFPLFRWRSATATFNVTEAYAGEMVK